MPFEITPETLVTRAPGLLAETILGETVILDVAADRYARLNSSGAVLWETLAVPTTVAGLAHVLATRFELPEGQALEDVTALVKQLAARDLVTI